MTLLVVLALLSPLPGQTTSAQPAFEVASIKPSAASVASSATIAPALEPDGRFTATGVTVRDLIRVAYGAPDPLHPSRITGGPDWIGSDRFDIVATAPAKSVSSPLPELLRSLLADRFKLRVRTETRELPVYALVVDRKDGSLGPDLQAAEDCTAARPEDTPAGTRPPLCGVRGIPGKLVFGGMPISALVFQPALMREVPRVMVDRTGLTGFFSGSLQWTPRALAASSAGAPDAASPPADGSSLFAALEEQLGLKLEPATASVDVLVIESVERPAAD